MPDNDWKKHDAHAAHSLVARRLAWGVQISYANGKDYQPHPNEPTWDLSVAELEWLLAMAKGEAPDG